jgi:hypothetical protein
MRHKLRRMRQFATERRHMVANDAPQLANDAPGFED